jgi:hypothetical protein
VDGQGARWRNAVRKSDYIGGFVFNDPYGPTGTVPLPVDKPVFDPPCVVPDDGQDATFAPIHGHSDFWPDPQVAVLTQTLISGDRNGAMPGTAPAGVSVTAPSDSVQ